MKKRFENDMKNIFNPENEIDFVFSCIHHFNKSGLLSTSRFNEFINFVAYKYEKGDEKDRKILSEKLDLLVEKFIKTKNTKCF